MREKEGQRVKDRMRETYREKESEHRQIEREGRPEIE